MISQETFYKEVSDGFKGVNGKLDNLCDRMGKLEGNFDKHIEIGKALRDQNEKSQSERVGNKDRKVYYVLGIFTVVFAAFEALRSYLGL